MNIRLAGIEKESVVDGPGIRFVIFTQGCNHNCPECHNPQTHDPKGGEVYTLDAIKTEIKAARGISGVTFSGGEPFLQAPPLADLVCFTKKLGLNTVIYSGYTFEQLQLMAKTNLDIQVILNNGDILIDGPFILAEKDLGLAFRGSKNQRVINLSRSIEEGNIVSGL